MDITKKHIFPQWMECEKQDEISRQLNSLSTDDLIALWNEYCNDNENNDLVIYLNNSEFFQLYSNDVFEAVRAISYGSYSYCDKFVLIDAECNLISYSEYDIKTVIKIDDLVEWIIGNSNNDSVEKYIDTDSLEFEFKECLRNTDENFLNDETAIWISEWMDKNVANIIALDWDVIYEVMVADYEQK